jgi:selenide,water dikinase
VVGFPGNRLPIDVLDRILEGARSKTDEAGISIIGGHTVDDVEPKFGLAVTGVVDPRKVVTNAGAVAGDTLVLTKPIGTGILSTALKRGLLNAGEEEELTAAMSSLNRLAAEAMQEIGVTACTDVSGFGLLGHLLEMMNGSGTSAVVSAGAVPILSAAVETAASGVVPGGTRDNFSYTRPHVEYDKTVSETMAIVLNDAQTSGGLLISVASGKASPLAALLRSKGVGCAAAIGTVVPARAKRIYVSR